VAGMRTQSDLAEKRCWMSLLVSIPRRLGYELEYAPGALVLLMPRRAWEALQGRPEGSRGLALSAFLGSHTLIFRRQVLPTW